MFKISMFDISQDVWEHTYRQFHFILHNMNDFHYHSIQYRGLIDIYNFMSDKFQS